MSNRIVRITGRVRINGYSIPLLLSWFVDLDNDHVMPEVGNTIIIRDRSHIVEAITHDLNENGAVLTVILKTPAMNKDEYLTHVGFLESIAMSKVSGVVKYGPIIEDACKFIDSLAEYEIKETEDAA